ncbi:MAG: hypothetical protein ACLQMH_00895 [Solirubrobacteraceae bacterium]
MRKFPTAREQNAYELGIKDAVAEQRSPLTWDEVKQMSAEQVAERKAEVDAFMKENAS